MSTIRIKLREALLKENFDNIVTKLNASPVPGKNGVYVFDNNGTKIYFRQKDPKTVELDLIETPAELRGSGNAVNAMQAFLSATDEFGYNVNLVVSPRDKSTDFKKLANFYKKFGFNFSMMGGFESDFEMDRRRKRLQ